MKTKIVQAVVIVLITGITGICLDIKKPKSSTIMFDLKNAENTLLHLYSPEVSRKFLVQKNNFEIKFEHTSPNYFNCVLNNDSLQLYLIPGDSIKIFANLEHFYESLEIFGSEACSYLLNNELAGLKEITKYQLNLLENTIKDKKKFHDFISAEYNRILRNHIERNMLQNEVTQNQNKPWKYYSLYLDIHLKTSVHTVL